LQPKEGGSPFTPDDCNRTINSYGYDLIQTMTSCTISSPSAVGDITGLDPQMSPVGNNGGRTQTQALMAGSPALDAGNPSGCTDLNAAATITDQRGFARSINGRCDIGAYEHPNEYFINQ
jgi:hypothetical protein